MKRVTPLIKCDQCHGAGQVPLPQHLRQTLDKFPKKGSVTAFELNDYFPEVTPNAISNRLLELLGLGVVVRQRAGHFWKYSRA